MRNSINSRIAVTAAIALALALGGCGGGGGGGGGDDSGGSNDTPSNDNGGNTDGDPVQSSANYTIDAPEAVNAPADRSTFGQGASVTLLSFGLNTSHQEFANLTLADSYSVPRMTATSPTRISTRAA